VERRQLQHFLAAAQHGSMHAAADAVAISQPALTKSIRRLETTLGVRLFERHARGVRLTVFGEALLLHARSLEAELRHAHETMRELRSTTSGLVRLGAGPSMTASLLPRLTERLMGQGPAIRLHVRTGLNDSLLAALKNGEIDFAITGMPAEPVAGLRHRPLFADNVVVAARRGHRLAAGGATMADLARSRWIMPNRNVMTHVRLAELFNKQGFDGPDIWIETDFVPYLLDVVAGTDLLSYVPAQLISRRDLVAIDMPGTTWRRAVSLSYWRRRTETPASRLLLSVLEEVVAELHAG
jgi:DNA-binding transcriptional LysR family regulator